MFQTKLLNLVVNEQYQYLKTIPDYQNITHTEARMLVLWFDRLSMQLASNTDDRIKYKMDFYNNFRIKFKDLAGWSEYREYFVQRLETICRKFPQDGEMYRFSEFLTTLKNNPDSNQCPQFFEKVITTSMDSFSTLNSILQLLNEGVQERQSLQAAHMQHQQQQQYSSGIILNQQSQQIQQPTTYGQSYQSNQGDGSTSNGYSSAHAASSITMYAPHQMNSDGDVQRRNSSNNPGDLSQQSVFGMKNHSSSGREQAHNPKASQSQVNMGQPVQTANKIPPPQSSNQLGKEIQQTQLNGVYFNSSHGQPQQQQYTYGSSPQQAYSHQNNNSSSSNSNTNNNNHLHHNQQYQQQQSQQNHHHQQNQQQHHNQYPSNTNNQQQPSYNQQQQPQITSANYNQQPTSNQQYSQLPQNNNNNNNINTHNNNNRLVQQQTITDARYASQPNNVPVEQKSAPMIISIRTPLSSQLASQQQQLSNPPTIQPPLSSAPPHNNLNKPVNVPLPAPPATVQKRQSKKQNSSNTAPPPPPPSKENTAATKQTKQHQASTVPSSDASVSNQPKNQQQQPVPIPSNKNISQSLQLQIQQFKQRISGLPLEEIAKLKNQINNNLHSCQTKVDEINNIRKLSCMIDFLQDPFVQPHIVSYVIKNDDSYIQAQLKEDILKQKEQLAAVVGVENYLLQKKKAAENQVLQPPPPPQLKTVSETVVSLKPHQTLPNADKASANISIPDSYNLQINSSTCITQAEQKGINASDQTVNKKKTGATSAQISKTETLIKKLKPNNDPLEQQQIQQQQQQVQSLELTPPVEVISHPNHVQYSKSTVIAPAQQYPHSQQINQQTQQQSQYSKSQYQQVLQQQPAILPSNQLQSSFPIQSQQQQYYLQQNGLIQQQSNPVRPNGAIVTQDVSSNSQQQQVYSYNQPQSQPQASQFDTLNQSGHQQVNKNVIESTIYPVMKFNITTPTTTMPPPKQFTSNPNTPNYLKNSAHHQQQQHHQQLSHSQNQSSQNYPHQQLSSSGLQASNGDHGYINQLETVNPSNIVPQSTVIANRSLFPARTMQNSLMNESNSSSSPIQSASVQQNRYIADFNDDLNQSEGSTLVHFPMTTTHTEQKKERITKESISLYQVNGSSSLGISQTIPQLPIQCQHNTFTSSIGSQTNQFTGLVPTDDTEIYCESTDNSRHNEQKYDSHEFYREQLHQFLPQDLIDSLSASGLHRLYSIGTPILFSKLSTIPSKLRHHYIQDILDRLDKDNSVQQEHNKSNNMLASQHPQELLQQQNNAIYSGEQPVYQQYQCDNSVNYYSTIGYGPAQAPQLPHQPQQQQSQQQQQQQQQGGYANTEQEMIAESSSGKLNSPLVMRAENVIVEAGIKIGLNSQTIRFRLSHFRNFICKDDSIVDLFISSEPTPKLSIIYKSKQYASLGSLHMEFNIESCCFCIKDCNKAYSLDISREYPTITELLRVWYCHQRTLGAD